MLNGISPSNIGAMIDGKQVSVNDPRIVEFIQTMTAAGHGTAFLEQSSPTDLSGTYKLAK